MSKANLVKLIIWTVGCLFLGSVLEQVSNPRDKAPPPPVIANDPKDVFVRIGGPTPDDSQIWKVKLNTDADVIYLVDAKGRGINGGEFTLPAEEPITIEFRRKK